VHTAVLETEERELKLTPTPGFQLPQGRGARNRSFTSTYHDTEDGRLAMLGITLRRRLESGKSVWQLKLPLASGRRELEVPGGPREVPAELRRLLLAVTRGRELQPVATLRTRRASVRVQENGSRAEIALDKVSIMEGRRVRETFEEVEVELLSGTERALARIGKRLRKAGAEEGDGRPKLFRVLGLDGSTPAPSRGAPPLEHVRSMLADQVGQALRHDPGVRLDADSEDLHDLRVATRRLRAVLRAARPLLDVEWAEALRSELSWLGSALGPVRDLDVLLAHLREEIAALPRAERTPARRLVKALETEREQARAVMLEALESDRYLALLDALTEASLVPRPGVGEESLAAIAGREFRRLRKAMRNLPPEPSPEELHRARIKAKRARYAAELAERAVGKKASRFVRKAKRFQDVAGEHQDALVAEERIRALLGSVRGARVAFAGGLLVERERARRDAARAAVPAAWRTLERAGARAWA
jgi:CHAD domain-containing protein